MARGSEKPLGIPYRIWTAKVEDQNRIRVSLAEASEVVTWINKVPGSIECCGMPGAAGGVQLQPVDAIENFENPYLAALAEHNVTVSHAGESWVDTARLFATRWLTSISVESSRISITLPEPPRRALQLPAIGEIAIVFGFGPILEVWIATQWYDHVRRLSREKISLVSRSIDDLRQT
ncbi:MAG TPA: hypothetical protein VKB58_02285 [Terriglobales bacterium]|jgi:hypothetical protein|nr:hypothetical protein [Terriglobales bacterium]